MYDEASARSSVICQFLMCSNYGDCLMQIMTVIRSALPFLYVGPVPCTTGDIRLVGGTNSLEGRVEVCNSSQWGTVCDNSWGRTDANVACGQLGFSSTGLYMPSS